jgi:hypothetical protein
MAYLYNYIGKPEKTTEKVHYILNNLYKNAPEGLIGNEDCGQMSAWYVLSSMGIYSVTPGSNYWETNFPSYFEKAKVAIENGTMNTVISQFEKTGFLSQESKESIDELPFAKITVVPIIEADSKSFNDHLEIRILSQNPTDKIYYLINGSNESTKDKDWKLYTEPLVLNETTEIRAKVSSNGTESTIVTANFFKKPNNYRIQIKGKYNSQYNAGGDDGLLDGIYSTENWRKGEWQGYQDQDFEAVIDLQEIKDISSISVRFLQDSRSWILMPRYVQLYTSTDNVNYKIVDSPILHTVDPKDDTTRILAFTIAQKVPNVRYVKVFAKNFGKLPEWHQGFGGDAFIFIDEITIR